MREDERFDEAIEAFGRALEFTPDDPAITEQLDETRAARRAKGLATLRDLAEEHFAAERWEQAVASFEEYLSLEPEDEEAIQAVEGRLVEAREQQELAETYLQAQAALSQKRYDEAVGLFKEIINRDVAYRDAIKLLGEAVELQRQTKPLWRDSRVLAGAGGAVVVVIAILLFRFLPGFAPAPTAYTSTPMVTAPPVPIPEATEATMPRGRTIVVSSTADSGPGTLRQALLEAESGDTITFDADVFPPDSPATILLKSVDSDSALPNINQGGLVIDASSAGVILDGSEIQGDWVNGLEVYSDGNVIQGLQIVNFSASGIAVCSSHNVIGGDREVGTGPLGQGNLSSKNGIGIDICPGRSHNTVAGNIVGTDPTDTDDWGNEADGIVIENGMTQNTIGPDNIIAHNHSNGIGIAGRDTFGNTITQNSIHDNDGMGIDLQDGGNTELAAPLITDFDLGAGTASGTACADCTVEVFSDNSDEGAIYEGQTMADDTGSFTLSKGAPFTGPGLTATATDANGNTSEFSAPAFTSLPSQASHRLILEGHAENVDAVAFSPDSTILASGSWDTTVILWDVESGQVLRTLEGHTDHVESVAFSPGGQMLASGSQDSMVILWDVESGQHVRQFGGMGMVHSLAFSPDGQTLAAGATDSTVTLWRVADGTLLRALEKHPDNIWSVVFSPDGQTLASGCFDGKVRLWRVSDGALLRTLDGHAHDVQIVVFSPDGQTLASGSHDNTVMLWDVGSGRRLHTLRGHAYSLYALAFSPDGASVASGAFQTVILWDVQSGQRLRTLEQRLGYVLGVAFAPDGAILVASGSEEGTVTLWRVGP